MVLEALLKSIRASQPGDKVVLVSNYTGEACSHMLTSLLASCPPQGDFKAACSARPWLHFRHALTPMG